MHPNPFRWNSQQLIGCAILVMIAAAIGAVVGNYLAFTMTSRFHDDIAFVNDMSERLTIIGAAIIGAAAALIVYAIQLLRR